MLRKILKPVLFACLMTGLLAGCSVSEKKEIQSLYGYSMGTSYSIKLVAGFNEAKNLQIGVEGVLSDINSRMSTYLPHSDLSLFAEQPVDLHLSVDPKTIKVVQSALEIAEDTDGAFDPTIAPLVDLWGFGPTNRQAGLPSDDEIKEQLSDVGYKAVTVDPVGATIRKSAPRSLDLSAIAKGYAVDELASYLEAKGYHDYLVEVGGEMRFSGQKPKGEFWRIAIEKPVVDERMPFRILEVRQGAIATSGDYRNYFELDGKRYSHTIDPETGYPIDNRMASVTVVMESCMRADAYATAFNVLGVEAALEFANEKDIALFIIYKQGGQFETVQSTAFTHKFGETLIEPNVQ